MRQLWPPLRYLATGVVTALAAWLSIGLMVLSVVVLPLLPLTAPAIRALVHVDRRRVATFTGAGAVAPRAPLTGPWLHRAQQVLGDPETWRDARWLVVHAVYGTVFGSLAVGFAGALVQQFVVPFVWWTVPGGMPNSFGVHVDSWFAAALSLPLALLCVLALSQVPRLARLDARWSRALLAAPLSQRVAELTATRAAALEAHGAELRRIERNLHDGTQNKLVGVVMMLGVAERTLQRSPADALKAVLTAQGAAEEALAELRNVVRSIHPPVLDDLGLDGAVAALAVRCPVPCVLEAESLGRLPAAVEAAAYFAVAEALTNVAKHSRAAKAQVFLGVVGKLLVVEVHDDGVGGADSSGGVESGTGLEGIRRRVAALDGRTTVTSPVGGPTVLRVELPRGA